MIRWFWRIYISIACLFVAILPFGGHLQETVSPIRTYQSITNVQRLDEPYRLCWDWRSIKNVNVVGKDIDVMIDAAGDEFSSYVFDKDTGMPWRKSGAVGLGPHKQSYCVPLPPGISAVDPVTVHQTILYPGWFKLWTVPVKIPDVVDAGISPRGAL